MYVSLCPGPIAMVVKHCRANVVVLSHAASWPHCSGVLSPSDSVAIIDVVVLMVAVHVVQLMWCLGVVSVSLDSSILVSGCGACA
eukprot:4762123-Amphidinium_carterae.1